MPTSPRVRYKGRGRTGGVEPRPYGTVCRGGRPCPPAPDNATPCRAGPVCPAGCGKNLSGRRGRRPLRMGCKKCVGEGLCPSRGRGRTPPLRKRYKGCNGRATARVAPTDGLQEVQWAGDRKGRPYGGLQVVQGTGRCRHRPLRKRNKKCNGRATARVAPTDGLQEVQWAGDHEGRPYGGIIWGHEVFLFSCKFILEKQLGICYTLHYSGNKFLSA